MASEVDICFNSFFPYVPSHNWMFMLEAMTYKVVIQIRGNLKPQDIQVQAWTSQCDRQTPDGSWHAVGLPYLQQVDKTLYEFGHSRVITSARDFQFTFRMRKIKHDGHSVNEDVKEKSKAPSVSDTKEKGTVNTKDKDCVSDADTWNWSHGFGENGTIHVEPPWDGDKWTQGSNYDHIQDHIHLGNFIAATNARELGITHVLNVADTLDMIYPCGQVSYKKVAMKDGAHNPIENDELKEAIDWLRANNKPGNKVLVNCRAGIGRAGSVAVGFVFAENSDMSYEQAYEFVYAKRFVYPHAYLKEKLHYLYPRT